MKIIEIDGIKYSLTPIEETQKPQTLTDVIFDWWADASDSSEEMDVLVEDLVNDIKQWLPEEAAVTEPGGDEWYVAWNSGYNTYREELLEKLK